MENSINKSLLKSLLSNTRNSRPEVFCKKGVLRNFAKFTGKHRCQTLFFNKVAGLIPATLLKKSLWHKFFTVNFVNFLRTPILTEYLWWLLLKHELLYRTILQKGYTKTIWT